MSRTAWPGAGMTGRAEPPGALKPGTLKPGALKRGRAPFALLAAAAFLSSAGARIIDPLMPVLAAEFDSSIGAVSAVIAAFTLPYGAMQLLLGPLGGRFGKLRVMVVAIFCYAATMAACALAGGLGELAALRTLTGASAAGLVPLALAYVGDAVPYRQRQVAMSRITAGFTIGQMMAGPLGGIFGDTLGWRGVFLVFAAVALTVGAALAARLRRLDDPAEGAGRFEFGRYRILATRPAARMLLLTCVIEGGLFAGCFPFVAPFMRDGWGLSYTRIGLTLACFGIGGLLYAAVARRLVPALGEQRLVLLGGVCMAAGMAGATAIGAGGDPTWRFVPVELALGFGYFTAHGVVQARATELLPQARSTAMSVFAFMLFAGQSLGALLIGGSVGGIGYRAALRLDAVGIVLLTVWLIRLFRRPAG